MIASIKRLLRPLYHRLVRDRKLDRTVVRAIHDAARQVATEKVPGGIVDCGSGSLKVFMELANAFSAVPDTSRSLVLLDVSGNPTQQPEEELHLWGGDTDLLDADSSRPPAVGGNGEASRVDGLGARYPADRLCIVRGSSALTDPEVPAQIAFLRITSERYPANRAAAARLLSRVSPGGVVMIERTRSADAAAHELAPGLQWRRVTSRFWIAKASDQSSAR